MLNKPAQGLWQALAPNYEIEPLAAAFRPARTPHVKIKQDKGVVVELDLIGRRARLDKENGKTVAAVLEHCNGKHTIAEIAHACGWPVDDAIQVVQELYHQGVLANGGDTQVPAMAFYKHLESVQRARQILLADELADVLKAWERPTRRLLVGTLLTDWHLVSAAANHIAPTMASAPSERLRMMFGDYMATEYWHGLALKDGLRAAGLSDADLERADPLPSTLGMINQLRILAASDLLAYSACIAASELGGGSGDQERIKKRYAAYVGNGLLTEDVVTPFRNHDLEDASANHLSYTAEAYAESGPLTVRQQNTIRRSVMLYLAALASERRELVRFFGPAEGPLYYVA